MNNLWLAAKARVLLALNEKTSRCSFKVRADNGVVTVAYLPRYAQVAGYIPQVLEKIEGLKDLRHTISTTNILWIQENYDPAAETFQQILEIANKWNAAVELLRMTSEGEKTPAEIFGGEVKDEPFPPETPPYNGGIEDDVVVKEEKDNWGLQTTLNELVKFGRSGGIRSAGETPQKILDSIDRSVPYSLIVVGNIFLSKAEATRKRMVRELQSLLMDNIKAPVVTAEDLKTQFLFGAKHLPKLIAFLFITVVLYILVFTNQEPIMNFLSARTLAGKCLAVLIVALFAPLIAYLYGTAVNLILKLIKME